MIEIVRAAQVALEAAQHREWRVALAKLVWLSNHKDQHAMSYAVQVWIDLHTLHASGGLGNHIPLGAGSLDVYDTDLRPVNEAADATPPAVRWCMRMMRARASGDEREFDNVCASLPDDETQRAAYIWTLLILCSNAIRELPRGYGMTGHVPVPKDVT
jgi:hypothetical protein